MTRATLQAAFILHHRPFKDTSVIADLITPDHGRVSVIARGARSASSRRRLLLQPFRPLLVSWAGRSELRTLTTVEESGLPVSLAGESLACAYYVTELALRLVSKDEPTIEAFALYARTLTTLAEIESQLGSQTDMPEATQARNYELCLREFEIELLDCLGLLPDFAHCDKHHEPIDATINYHFHPPSGHATRVDPDEPVMLESVEVSGLTLLAMGQRELRSAQHDHAVVLPQAKKLMRQIVRLHLGSQPLKSREVFKQLRSFSSPDKPN